MKHTQVIILAAGNSTRMKSEVPKVLLDVAGSKMIERVVAAAENAVNGLKPVVVISPQNDEAIKEVLGEACEYVVQKEQMGTGHAVNAAQSLVGDRADQVVILYGDHPLIRSSSIQKLVDAHASHEFPLSMMTFEVHEGDDLYEHLKDFGRVQRNSLGDVYGIVEMKDADEGELLIAERNPGYYCIDRKWLWDNLSRLQNNNAQGEYYLTDLVGLAVSQGHEIQTVQVEDVAECFGVNNQEQLEWVRVHIRDY